MKRAWYRAEQRLRNQIERSYETRMDFTLTQLEGSAPGSGVDTPPDTDVLAMLRVAAGAVEAPVVGAISDDEAWLRSGATDPE